MFSLPDARRLAQADYIPCQRFIIMAGETHFDALKLHLPKYRISRSAGCRITFRNSCWFINTTQRLLAAGCWEVLEQKLRALLRLGAGCMEDLRRR
jgi:hypothetical protein